MAQTSRPWTGTVLGDAGGYTDDDWTEVWRRFLGAVGDADTGILSNVANELNVTGIATPLSVATGVALVDGTFYESTAVETVPVATPGVGVTIHRVVLRKDWGTQTVRIYLLLGVDGAGVPLPLVQNDGTTWDMPLFQASINLGGVITLTDERERLFTRQPSMTTAERDAMTPVNGMQIYNETTLQIEGYEGGAWTSVGASDFQRIIASGNWTKPAGASTVYVVCIGGGGGGGGGEGQAAGQIRCGGGGGGGGAYAQKMYDAAVLGAVEAVTIGAGGAAGVGGTNADGTDGTAGGNTDFGTILYAYGGGLGERGGATFCDGGGGGGTGSASTGAGGGSPFWDLSQAAYNALAGAGASSHDVGGFGSGFAGAPAEYGGGAGSLSAQDGILGLGGGDSLYGAGAGGSGGGLTAGNAETVGGPGGGVGSYATGGGGAGGAVNGGAGTAGAASVDDFCGEGGGGGGSQDAGNGGAAGAGGAPGGGGGGGGGGTNTGGAGAVGGRGECRVWAW